MHNLVLNYRKYYDKKGRKEMLISFGLVPIIIIMGLGVNVYVHATLIQGVEDAIEQRENEYLNIQQKENLNIEEDFNKIEIDGSQYILEEYINNFLYL